MNTKRGSKRAIPATYRIVSTKGISKQPDVAAQPVLMRFLWNVHMRGVLRKELECSIGVARFAEISGETCFYCDAPPYLRDYGKGLYGHANGVDRLDNTLGYVEGNVVAACKTCNGMKSGMPAEEFIAACQRVADRVRALPE